MMLRWKAYLPANFEGNQVWKVHSDGAADDVEEDDDDEREWRKECRW